MVLKPHSAILLLALGLLDSAAQGGSLQQPPFTATTRVVYVDVVALDGDRNPITDLSAADFEIREDGKPRPLAAFTKVQLGPRDRNSATRTISSSLPRTVPPGTASSEWPSEGRLIVIFFDRTIPTAAVPAARVIADAAIGRLAPGDLATVVRAAPFSGPPVIPEFTEDRAMLQRIVNGNFMGMTTPPEMSPDGLRDRVPNRQNQGDCWCGTCSYEYLRGIAEALRDVPRLRKLLFFIGTDMTQETTRGTACMDPIIDAKKQLGRALTAANLTVHTFDPLGLTTDSAGAGALPGFTATARRHYGIERRNALADLPNLTGGRTVLNTNAPHEEVRAALDESSSYYLLGFEPAKAPDGRYHRIEVKVRRPTRTLAWRKTYLAAR